MVREGTQVRAGRPILLTNCHTGQGVDAVVEKIAAEVLFDRRAA
jgi:urease accessory protein